MWKNKYRAQRILSKNTIESTLAMLTPPPSSGLPTVGVGSIVEEAVVAVEGATLFSTGDGGGHLPGLLMLHFDHTPSVSVVSFNHTLAKMA